MTAVRDLGGQRFGHWTVSHRAGSDRRGQATWVCRCTCGNQRSVVGWRLFSGRSKSCGCQTPAYLSMAAMRHGHARKSQVTPEYTAWQKMIQRCCDPAARGWLRYGGRGIRVCDRWKLFDNFLSDMGARPSVAHSLDRIDNDGHYAPGNVRWATTKEQSRNRSTARNITIDGVTKCITDWVAEYGVAWTTVYKRMSHGWSEVDAITTPPKGRVNNAQARAQEHWRRLRADRVDMRSALDEAADLALGVDVSRDQFLVEAAMAFERERAVPR